MRLRGIHDGGAADADNEKLLCALSEWRLQLGNSECSSGGTQLAYILLAAELQYNNIFHIVNGLLNSMELREPPAGEGERFSGEKKILSSVCLEWMMMMNPFVCFSPSSFLYINKPRASCSLIFAAGET